MCEKQYLVTVWSDSSNDVTYPSNSRNCAEHMRKTGRDRVKVRLQNGKFVCAGRMWPNGSVTVRTEPDEFGN